MIIKLISNSKVLQYIENTSPECSLKSVFMPLKNEDINLSFSFLKQNNLKEKLQNQISREDKYKELK